MRDQDVGKMFTFLRGVCSDGEHPQLIKALGFAREMHAGQTRKGGQPYLVHPLSVACLAIGTGFRDDSLLATLVLHDVPEDCGVLVSELPCNDDVKLNVECMTIRRLSGETKLQTKKRYYENLRKRRFSTIGKGFDRIDNLSTMAESMSKESIEKNVYETFYFLLPLMKEAKEMWPEYSNQLHVIRFFLKSLTFTLAADHKIVLADEMPSDEVLTSIFER